MKLSQRRLIYSLFFLAFFIIGPLTVWYALGFRWDPLSNQFVKVGAAFIKSYPANAKIFRDGQNTGQKTAHQLINIPVGQHEFLVFKDGYEPWSKRLAVEAGKTTFIEDIVLFKTTFERQTITETPNATVSVSPEQNKYAFIQDTVLYIFDTKESKPIVRYTVPRDSSIKSWSSNEAFLLIKNASGYSLLSTENDKTTAIPFQAKDMQTNDGLMLWSQNGNIVSKQTISSAAETVATNTKEFLLRDRLALLKLNGELELQSIDGKREWSYLVPNESHLVMLRGDVVLLQVGNEIQIVDKEGVRERVNGQFADWRNDKILFSNDFEIWSYTVSDHRLNLIDRTGKRMQKVFWHPSQSYITVVQNNQLYVLELDNRGEKRHRTFLTSADSTNTFLYNKKGDEFSIIGPHEHYRLQIQ